MLVIQGRGTIPLPPILVVFGSARFVSYVLWVSAANVADQSLRDIFGSHVAGWGAIALQITGFALIVVLMRLDWCRLFRRKPPAPSEQSRPLDYQEMSDAQADDPRA